MSSNFRLFFFLVLLPSFSFGQTIKGFVFDSNKQPVVGAYVLSSLSDEHAHTNELGQFLMKNIPISDTLEVIFLGYETEEYVVNDLSEEIQIKMDDAVFDLGEITVGQNVKKVNLISNIDMKLNPVSSSQEVLAIVPGLFIGQHAGGGKAEQIFLRGFDIDHGTDVNISVDGLPVNMVSHAHGQGYADLHFVIPETVELIDFGKGPYYADKGNFGTAGYVEMRTKEQLDNSSIKFEYGQFNTLRAVAMLDVLSTEKHNAYFASEYLLTDGPVESPQNFNRTNVFFKYTGKITDKNKVSLLASHFTSKWDASGQIPQRAVDEGLITRYGSIDDTEGGFTSRTNVALNFSRALNNETYVKNTIFYSAYDFELFSNFTFFLEDPENGDQIRQFEERQIFGAESVWNRSFFIGDNIASLVQMGGGIRHDDIDGNTLARTKNRRTTLENLSLGDVDETNLYAFAKIEFDINNLLIEPSLRLDNFKFNYVNQLNPLYETQVNQKTLLSPKLNVVYNANPSTQLYAKSGVGFHSNDTRVVIGDKSKQILPAAIGSDLGMNFKPSKRLFVNAALWYLFLEQEFVYVGDAGIVEPSGRSRRMGADFGFRWQLMDNLFANADINYALPRSIDEQKGEDRIPLAPNLTSTGGLIFKKNKYNAGINYRWLKDRPANEDNSIVAEGYFITDLNANYEWSQVSIGFSIENLFDQEWNETQFATESRLDFEPVSVEEIHFTPGTPFFIKGNFQYKF